MKANNIFLFVVCIALNASCTGALHLESETDVTDNYLFTDKDGLSRAIAGLYIYERDEMAGYHAEETPIMYIVQMLDYNTDILLFRAGNCADIGRLNTMTSASEGVAQFWKIQYNIVGRANDIIAACEKIGLDDPEVKAVWAEAKLFRGRAFFDLLKRFGRIYLNTEVTNYDNIKRTFTPASSDAVYAQIDKDLDDAVDGLDWSLPQQGGMPMYGRFTKAVAKHVRAQVAMWESDWTRAINECEDIFENGTYHMLGSTKEVFSSENLRNAEVLYAYQFSMNVGGGGVVSGTSLMGHALPANTTAEYKSIPGCKCESAQGGRGFGRMNPNSYLLSLYDQTKDRRYNEMFVHWYYYNVEGGPHYGEVIPRGTGGYDYARYLHPMSIKHADFWTNQDQPDRMTSFRDLIVYRLAETALMCSEAYFHRDGPASPEAVKYFNMTYERAGNDHFDGSLTLDDLLDEYARELNFEGVRWPLLKRLGILYERVVAHAGDNTADEPLLAEDYDHARHFFVRGKHENWPIPANEILLMGEENFPQNEGWN
ncbi:MAG: RagB/SusD family nutrient uptake outer membrane protein [Bacteroidales bacterium]|nr:RagB/SusD family nutrient uptake outer membrane protein [Bacteroidales bacterium]